MACTCRKLTIDDEKEVYDLFLSVFSCDPWNDQWEEKQLHSYLTSLLDEKSSLCFGLYRNEELIGLSLGKIHYWWEGNEYRIEEFCIRTDLQNHGYGATFLRLIEPELASHDLQHMFLLTERTVPAYTFYKLNGFRELRDNVAFVKGVTGHTK